MTTQRFADSFDHYPTANLLNKYTALVSTPTIGAFGRNGTNGLRCSGADKGAYKVLTSEQYHYVAASFNSTSVTPSSDTPLISLRDGATVQVDVRITTAGKIRVTRGGTTLATGTTTLTAGVSVYVEFLVKIDNTTGTVDVWLNGAAATEISLTGQDTQATANATADTLLICGVFAGMTVDVDDLVWNSNSAGAETRWGDNRVEYIAPNGNGNSSQWVGSDGNSTDNYLLVDETSPNGDTDYVASSTVGDIDLYTFGNLTPTTGAVKCVYVHMYARKDDAGTRTIAAANRDSGTNSFGANIDLSTTYNYYSQVWELNPRTSAAWTISEVNADEFGVKAIA